MKLPRSHSNHFSGWKNEIHFDIQNEFHRSTRRGLTKSIFFVLLNSIIFNTKKSFEDERGNFKIVILISLFISMYFWGWLMFIWAEHGRSQVWCGCHIEAQPFSKHFISFYFSSGYWWCQTSLLLREVAFRLAPTVVTLLFRVPLPKTGKIICQDW